eukprot:187846-Prorocentrum_minimum.AAC.1
MAERATELMALDLRGAAREPPLQVGGNDERNTFHRSCETGRLCLYLRACAVLANVLQEL